MTDEEKAEDYADKILSDSKYPFIFSKEKVKGYIIKVYLDSLKCCKDDYDIGLVEGRKEKWHDLRKNPDDLPTKTRHYLTDDGECIYDAFHKKWRTIMCDTCWGFRWLDDGDVIAWCELPKFEE